MIHIKRIEIYREFQKNIFTLVHNEALMCGFKEYSVSVRNHHTEVKIFVHRYSAVLTFYISGRVVVKLVNSSKDNYEQILHDEVDMQYASGKCSVPDLASRYVYEIFDEALKLRQRWRAEYKARYNERMAAFAAAVNESVGEVC
ncbi:MAG: hypothetical protein IJ555_15045 [Ruminococcus sp.]|nr:hypothetical protein [Ruminococcus sp.]